MIEQKTTSSKMHASLLHATSTVLRCHLIGSITAAALILCIAWVWSISRIEVATIQYNGRDIDLRDAAALIENADQWRRLYTVNYQQSQGLDQRAESIALWLPRSVDWATTQHDIRSIGETAGISILSIKPGERHVGTRVGVVSASCDVHGTYASLCRFLSELSNRPQPIACSEIQLERTVHAAANHVDDATPRCRATLSLRIPFAAAGTPAQRLLPTETKNAS